MASVLPCSFQRNPEPTGTSETITFISNGNLYRDPGGLEALRTERIYCDLELKCRNIEYTVYAHRVILRLGSSYFARELIANPECTCIKIPLYAEMNPICLDLLVKYIYTGKLEIPINSLTIRDIIIAAGKLELEEINVHSCIELLVKKLSWKNCCLILGIARELNLGILITEVKDWLKVNLAHAVSDEEFMDVEYASVQELITLAPRPATTETTLFKLILKWVEKAADTRKDQLYDLMKVLNFEELFVNEADLLKEEFQEGSLLSNDKRCTEMYNTLRESNASGHRDVLIQKEQPKSLVSLAVRLPRLSILLKPMPVALNQSPMGRGTPRKSSTSTDGTEGPTIALRNRSGNTPLSAKRSRKNADQTPITFEQHLKEVDEGIAGSGEEMKLLYFRQYNGKTFLINYDFRTNVCKELYQVRKPRKNVNLVVAGDSIYSIGGSFHADPESSGLTDVEVFRQGSEVGRVGPELQAATKNPASCVFNNCIYVTGGEALTDGENRTHNTTQMLDLSKTDNLKWKLMDYMHHTRDSHGLAVLGDHIYAVAGFGTCFRNHEDTYPMNTVERYSPANNCWELLKESYLRTPRVFLQVCNMENKLYAVGGYNYEIGPLSSSVSTNQDSAGNREKKKVILNTVEVYDPNNKGIRGWYSIATMNEERHSGVVFSRNGLLYAVGGNHDPVPNAEVYDPRVNAWTLLTWPSELPNPEEVGLEYYSAILLP